MPELPDITVYVEALSKRLLNQHLRAIEVRNPFLLRTAEPSINLLTDQRVEHIHRVGKRIVFELSNRYWLSLHLMIAGRLHWLAVGAKNPPKTALMILGFDEGTLYLTEAGSKRRASLHVYQGEGVLNAINPGGREIRDLDLTEFSQLLTNNNHTLKRVLTDPKIFSGIGNAYSDEILHKAKLSPILQSQKMSKEEIEHLFAAARESLVEWTDLLRARYGDKFPEKVTAFRPEMAVHGKYNQPCPVCQTPVQRIRYASNETNYCPGCQTSGRVLADRALSRLLKKDWPRTVEELEKF